MALYEYVCEACGPFEAWSGMDRSGLPCACPGCGADSARQLAAPGLALMNHTLRRALERSDRSAAEPRVAPRKHLAGCGCSLCSLRPGPKASSSRWAIGH